MTNAKLDLRNPIFHDDNAARKHLEALLWPQGPVCPRCGVTDDRITKLQGKSTRPGVYKCKDCRKPFSVTVGTVMERSHIPLSKWVLAAQLMASSKKSMSAHQLHRMLGTNYETAWFLFHRLREAANDISGSDPIGGENKIVEADETFIGGKARNKAFGPPPKKYVVFTLVERGRRSAITAYRQRRCSFHTRGRRDASQPRIVPDDRRGTRLREIRPRVLLGSRHRQPLSR
jgi:transposase-like protein